MNFSHSWIKWALLLTAGASIVFSHRQAIAADTIILQYGIFQRSLSVDELSTFAETGETSSSLQYYLNASQQNPESVRQVLTEEVEIDVVTLDRALNNPVGGLLLDI